MEGMLCYYKSVKGDVFVGIVGQRNNNMYPFKLIETNETVMVYPEVLKVVSNIDLISSDGKVVENMNFDISLNDWIHARTKTGVMYAKIHTKYSVVRHRIHFEELI